MVRNYKRKTENRWTKEVLLEALIEIQKCRLSVAEAGVKYKIPRATLYRRWKKFTQSGGRSSIDQLEAHPGKPILTRMEEQVLENTVLELRKDGYVVDSSDIKHICFEYCESSGIPVGFNVEKRMATDDWYYGFLKRHPRIKMEKPHGGQEKKKMTKNNDSLKKPAVTPRKLGTKAALKKKGELANQKSSARSSSKPRKGDEKIVAALKERGELEKSSGRPKKGDEKIVAALKERGELEKSSGRPKKGDKKISEKSKK